MLYIISLMVCFFLVWKYDWRGETKNKSFWFYALLLWFIVLSGFQYCVGADTPRYMHSYQQFPKQFNIILFNYDDLGGRLQPGWILLTWFCRQFSNDFLLFKIVQAAFFNVAVFSFFKRESKYVFLCIFFYAVSDYLVINFNVLRQSFSIAFGLYAFSYLKKRMYFKYALFVVLAYLFHNSALILLMSVFVIFFKTNKGTMWISLCTFAVVIFALRTTSIDTILYYVSDDLVEDSNSVDLLMRYSENEKLGMRSVAKTSMRFLIVLFVVVYSIVIRRDLFWGGFGIMYSMVLLMTTMMPILWRFRLFFDFPYYIMLASFITETPLQIFRQLRQVFYIGAIITFMFFPIRGYFKVNMDGRHRYIDQYYPYHSVFDPKLEERL